MRYDHSEDHPRELRSLPATMRGRYWVCSAGTSVCVGACYMLPCPAGGVQFVRPEGGTQHSPLQAPALISIV
eukprot:3646686-Pleurochrysis_carterae.AAC.1